MGKIILVSSPKGGSGKSVLARHLLACARLSGLNAVGIDYDVQGTFDKWSQRRAATRKAFPELVSVEVKPASLQQWRAGLVFARQFDLAILDTPPSVEDHLAAILGLADQANLIVVPSLCTQDDVDSVAPWLQKLGERGNRAVIVLNRGNRRTQSFGRMRGKLVKVADVCPSEIPQLEDVHVPSGKGLTLFDYPKSRGKEPFDEVWSYVWREIGK